MPKNKKEPLYWCIIQKDWTYEPCGHTECAIKPDLKSTKAGKIKFSIDQIENYLLCFKTINEAIESLPVMEFILSENDMEHQRKDYKRKN